ncbi:hypothetical protein ABLG96_04220 [Nakamurella sp. A5-74]|uniref:Uncharacterized protein n=1 Tax=Nakamurella sp. A5-74 TaxID=3158264 RepID=A0AAU8DRV3_9ACTN
MKVASELPVPPPELGGAPVSEPPVADPLVSDPPVADPLVSDPPVSDPLVAGLPVPESAVVAVLEPVPGAGVLELSAFRSELAQLARLTATAATIPAVRIR